MMKKVKFSLRIIKKRSHDENKLGTTDLEVRILRNTNILQYFLIDNLIIIILLSVSMIPF